MEILKKKIEEHFYRHGLEGSWLKFTDVKVWIKEFEERQNRQGGWLYHAMIADLQKELDKEQKKSAHLESIYLETRSTCREWEIKYSVLKTTFERANKYSLSHSIMFKTPEVKSLWIEIDTPPKDDETVWGINESVSEIPFLVWYDEDIKEFLLLDSTRSVSVALSHWCPIPKPPSEYDNS